MADNDALTPGIFVESVQQSDRVNSSGDGGDQSCSAGMGSKESADGCGDHVPWLCGDEIIRQGNRAAVAWGS